MLSLKVESFAELTQTLAKKGQHCFGNVGLLIDGSKWAIQLYPYGDLGAKEGSISVFLKNLTLPRGVAALKIEGNIRIIDDDGKLRLTKAFIKSSYINPTANGVSQSSSWGFSDFSSHADLPEGPFSIEAEIFVKETALDNALSLKVSSMTTVRSQFARGQSILGRVYTDEDGGKWSMCLYPNGDNVSRANQIGLFVKILSLPHGVLAVKIEGSMRVLSPDGEIISTRSFPVSTFLNMSGNGMASSCTWGFHDMCDVKDLGESFSVEAEITIKEKALETPKAPEVPQNLSVNGLLEYLKVAHQREVDEARNAVRVLSETQLCALTLDQLMGMQADIANIIRQKRQEENECSVCRDEVKSVACVPCGHRFCGTCCKKLTNCPECRKDISQTLRLY